MGKPDINTSIVRSDGGLDFGRHARSSADAEKKVPHYAQKREDGRKNRPSFSRRSVNMAVDDAAKNLTRFRGRFKV